MWDGVANAQALINIRRMQPGDQVLIYHSGDVRALIGFARVVSHAYPDPKLDDPKRAVVDVEAGDRLQKPIPLAAIKADPNFADLLLVRHSRLSVVPVGEQHWQRLIEMIEHDA